jgi:hypothetical protein
MMMKIHMATPASFRLIDLAKAGVAIKMTKPPIKLGTNDLFILNISHSPFLLGSSYEIAFHMPI